MAKFEIIEGAPGQGKSLFTARRAKQLLARNKKFYERMSATYAVKLHAWEKARQLQSIPSIWEAIHPQPVPPKRRQIASNIKFSETFEAQHEGWIIYWANLEELHEIRHVDIIWDEIATELDSRNWPNLSPETMRMLSQYRKRGLDIYANTQDFSMVDARARLMITGVSTLSKLMGSGDISTTKPPPSFIWGVVLIRGVQNFKQTAAEKKTYSFFDWSFMLIEKSLIEIYDTTQDIKQGTYPPLRKIVRVCPEDGYVKTTYV